MLRHDAEGWREVYYSKLKRASLLHAFITLFTSSEVNIQKLPRETACMHSRTMACREGRKSGRGQVQVCTESWDLGMRVDVICCDVNP